MYICFTFTGQEFETIADQLENHIRRPPIFVATPTVSGMAVTASPRQRSLHALVKDRVNEVHEEMQSAWPSPVHGCDVDECWTGVGG